MIECKNLCVRRGAKEIISNFSMRCLDGTITVILGKNGCGKTTLLNAVAGLCNYNGSITVNGIEVKAYKRKEFSKTVALMPQILTRPPVTVKQLVSFGRSPYTGISSILSPSDIKSVNHAVETVGIENILSQTVDKISGGERRKAFFAMLLTQNTDNVLLDEPCANLDAEYVGKISELITDLKQDGKTVVAVFHDVNTAFQIADQVIFIENGKCVFDGTPHDAMKNCLPEKIFSLKPYYCTDKQGNNTVFYK